MVASSTPQLDLHKAFPALRPSKQLLLWLQEEFFQETVRKVQALYQFDCLRANKSTMAWGVEARVPFLDRHFLDVAMAIDPAEKMIDKANGERFRSLTVLTRV